MERGSDKHGFRTDDGLEAETRGLIQGNHSTHAEEWNDPEPSGEDQPDSDLAPDSTLIGGTPDGMSADDVEGRSELATYLGAEIYPALGQQLLERAEDQNAPDRVLALLRGLPSGRSYENVNHVWESLGGHVEQHRS